jgi:hypothetical protein
MDGQEIDRDCMAGSDWIARLAVKNLGPTEYTRIAYLREDLVSSSRWF